MLNWILQYWTGIAFGALSGIVLALWKQLKAYKRGLIALLYNNLLEEHEKYIVKKWIPIWAMENFGKSYEAYRVLEENPAITKLYEELAALPSQPPNNICSDDEGGA